MQLQPETQPQLQQFVAVPEMPIRPSCNPNWLFATPECKNAWADYSQAVQNRNTAIQRNQMIQAHNVAVAVTANQAARQAEATANQYNTQMADVRSNYDSQISDLNAQILELNSKHDAEVSGLRSEYTSEVKNLNSQIDALTLGKAHNFWVGSEVGTGFGIVFCLIVIGVRRLLSGRIKIERERETA